MKGGLPDPGPGRSSAADVAGRPINEINQLSIPRTCWQERALGRAPPLLLSKATDSDMARDTDRLLAKNGGGGAPSLVSIGTGAIILGCAAAAVAITQRSVPASVPFVVTTEQVMVTPGQDGADGSRSLSVTWVRESVCALSLLLYL